MIRKDSTCTQVQHDVTTSVPVRLDYVRLQLVYGLLNTRKWEKRNSTLMNLRCISRFIKFVLLCQSILQSSDVTFGSSNKPGVDLFFNFKLDGSFQIFKNGWSRGFGCPCSPGIMQRFATQFDWDSEMPLRCQDGSELDPSLAMPIL